MDRAELCSLCQAQGPEHGDRVFSGAPLPWTQPMSFSSPPRTARAAGLASVVESVGSLQDIPVLVPVSPSSCTEHFPPITTEAQAMMLY